MINTPEQHPNQHQLQQQLHNHFGTAQNPSSGPPYPVAGPSQPVIPHLHGPTQQTQSGGPPSQTHSQNQGVGLHGIGIAEHLGGLSGGPSPGPPAISLLAAAAAAGAGPHHFANGAGFNLELQVRLIYTNIYCPTHRIGQIISYINYKIQNHTRWNNLISEYPAVSSNCSL